MLTAALSGSALADVVVLKDGSKREGKIVKEDDKQVVLEIAQGRLKAQIILERAEIQSIEKGETSNERLVKEVERRRKKLRANDKAGWLEYARWLDRQNGFSKEAKAAYEKVITIDKDNEVARRRLGYRKVAGQWMTEEEIMIAKGYVKHAGKWMTPEDKAKVEAAEKKKLENVRIALAEEIAREREKKADADATARQKWLKDMQALAAERAARQRQGAVVQTQSGGVVLGPHGYGYYGVRTPAGTYIPYVPYTGPVQYYRTGTYYGTYPYVTSSRRRRRVSTGYHWGVRYHDKHWDIGLGSGGTRVIYTKKKK
jgi:hypothetical protein